MTLANLDVIGKVVEKSLDESNLSFQFKLGIKNILDAIKENRHEWTVEAIPTEFIKEWFKEHYRTNACPLVNDWEEFQKKGTNNVD